MQKAIQDWCGAKLDLVDDRTVTSEDTWLLNDNYLRMPVIVVGNTQDNRLLHAMGTRYLCASSHSWPGGDRYVIRLMFEPFVADVNYLTIEASTEAGAAAAATAKLADLLNGFGEQA